MKGIKLIIYLLANPKRLKALMLLNNKSYLQETGWLNSYISKESIDGNGSPIPEFTYPFIDFIVERLNKDLYVFEYDSGNSTHFYSRYTSKIISLEHDKKKYHEHYNSLPDNSELYFCDLDRDGNYCRFANKLGKKFDLVSIAGRDRLNCCKQALNILTEKGVIVLNDSNKIQVKEASNFLHDNGFKEISFIGLSPRNHHTTATSVFYKPLNCLSI